MAEPTFAMIVPLGGSGARPDQGLPGYGHPDQGLPGSGGVPGHLPAPPAGTFPPPSPAHPIVPAPPTTPPGSIWPPPNRPDAGLPTPPVHPGQGLPTPPPTVGGGPVVPSGKFWIVAGIPGVGWRYVCVDPSLDAGMPLPGGGYPDNTLPGTPSTKPITPPPAQPKS